MFICLAIDIFSAEGGSKECWLPGKMLFTHSRALKFVNTVTKPPLMLSLSLLQFYYIKSMY